MEIEPELSLMRGGEASLLLELSGAERESSLSINRLLYTSISAKVYSSTLQIMNRIAFKHGVDARSLRYCIH